MNTISSFDPDTKNSPNQRLSLNLWPLLPVSLIATLLYFEGLFRNKSIMYGDAIVHGYPILTYHKAVLNGDASLLWSNLIYGGYPLHAEGQFSFFSPLNIAVAYFFTPELGQNVFHWLCLILTGVGMLALCRRLGLSNLPAVFASLAVTFSSYWLLYTPNLTVSGSMALIPWVLWSFERWIANPSQYLALAITVALMIFSGYPQLIHGAAIYMAISLVSFFLTDDLRRQAFRDWAAYIGYGLAAVLICIGISAVQLIPLMELVGLSHRNSGTELIFFAWPTWFYRGLLFNPIAAHGQYFPLVGSLLICGLASTAILHKSSARYVGHIVATLLLFSLGLGMGSPIFMGLYDSQLSIGLHFFRSSFAYFSLAVIGISLMAASSINKYQEIDFHHNATKLKLLCLALFWIAVLTMYAMHEASLLQYFIAFFALLCAIIFVIFSVRQYLGPLVLALLVVEILLVKFPMLVFHNNELLKASPSIRFMKSEGNFPDYKFYDSSAARANTLKYPPVPHLDVKMRWVLDSISGSSNLLWDIPSFGGAFALPLARRMLVEDRMKKEIQIKRNDQSGLRLLDYLGIKYIAVNDYRFGDYMRPAYDKKLSGVKVVHNRAALPRFQTFTDYQWVESPEEAAATIGKLENKVLVLERPSNVVDVSALPNPEPEFKDTSNGLHFSTKEAKSTYYKFAITADNPGFFFIADANYPGWKAKIDGKPTPVFSAQVLGKAVMVPKGQHTLEVYFQSNSFRLGLIISIATLLFAAVLGSQRWRGNPVQ